MPVQVTAPVPSEDPWIALPGSLAAILPTILDFLYPPGSELDYLMRVFFNIMDWKAESRV